MMESPRFITICCEGYRGPWEELDQAEQVERMSEALHRRGFVHQPWRVVGEESHESVIRCGMERLRKESADPAFGQGMILYLNGHGAMDGDSYRLVLPESPRVDEGLSYRTLGEWLSKELRERDDSTLAWRFILLDTCHSREGITQIFDVIRTDVKQDEDRRNCIIFASGEGTTWAGSLGRVLTDVVEGIALEEKTPPLYDVARRIVDSLRPGADGLKIGEVDPELTWPSGAEGSISHGAAPVDIVPKLQEVLRTLPETALRHFLRKARGVEVLERPEVEFSALPWHFVGRQQELDRVGSWLSEETGLLCVTGRAGAGKSALLGMVLASSIPELMTLLREREGGQDQPSAPLPEGFAFDAVLHLSGQSAADFIQAIATALGLEPVEHLEEMVKQVAARYPDGVRILSDALDEAVDPIPIAHGLRSLGQLPGAQVVVGSRRNLGERIDDPDRAGEALIEHLDAASTVEVSRDPEAIERYLRTAFAEAGWEDDLALRCAAGIALRDRPFLFARLALHELLADPTKAEYSRLEPLLDAGHGGIFAISYERIRNQNPKLGTLLRSLAYSFGRGFPRTDGIWLEAARALHDDPDDLISEGDITEVLTAAAPYIMVDTEHDRSVFRLAHRTYREYFEDLDRAREGSAD